MANHNTIKLLFSLIMSASGVTAFGGQPDLPPLATEKANFHINTLFLQPGSDNLKYAVFVSGNQPRSQSWHNQSIDPSYSPAVDLGFSYVFLKPLYDISIDWLYLNADSSSSKQASQNTNISTVEFVAPPYDVGPAVFGIKRADSTVNYNFNDIGINIGRLFHYSSNLKVRLFGGVNFLRITQDITTTFSDYAGSPLIPSQAYTLPADSSFYFTTENSSNYLGAGPDFGINAQYVMNNGFGVVGQILGAITAGSMSTSDNFTSASASLQANGISTSYQAITAPDETRVVPGLDTNLGVLYNHSWRKNAFNLAVELGYRFAYYFNAISEIYPTTLVQAGTTATIPEFATGTMAINSTGSKYSPFILNGPYLNVTFTFF